MCVCVEGEGAWVHVHCMHTEVQRIHTVFTAHVAQLLFKDCQASQSTIEYLSLSLYFRMNLKAPLLSFCMHVLSKCYFKIDLRKLIIFLGTAPPTKLPHEVRG